MHIPLATYLSYLFLTLAIETPLVLLLLVRRCGWFRSALVAVLASSTTHPLLWFVWSRVVSWRDHYGWYVATGEALVVLIEAGIFFAIALPKQGACSRMAGLALGVSLIVNFVSWGSGMLMNQCGLLRAYVATASSWMQWALGWFD